jgi:hypothetical protein
LLSLCIRHKHERSGLLRSPVLTLLHLTRLRIAKWSHAEPCHTPHRCAITGFRRTQQRAPKGSVLRSSALAAQCTTVPRKTLPCQARPRLASPQPPMKAAGKARRPSVLPSQPLPSRALLSATLPCHARRYLALPCHAGTYTKGCPAGHASETPITTKRPCFPRFSGLQSPRPT